MIIITVLVVLLLIWAAGNGYAKTLAQFERKTKHIVHEAPKVTATVMSKGGSALKTGVTLAQVKMSETKDRSSSKMSEFKARVAEERALLAREAGEVDEIRAKRVDASRSVA
jgi:hypothetical protein